MQKYVEVAFSSRWLDPDFDWIPVCEACKEKQAHDVDHIRWRKWKLLTDPFNLIFVCRKCHENKWWFFYRQEWSEIVRLKL